MEIDAFVQFFLWKQATVLFEMFTCNKSAAELLLGSFKQSDNKVLKSGSTFKILSASEWSSTKTKLKIINQSKTTCF